MTKNYFSVEGFIWWDGVRHKKKFLNLTLYQKVLILVIENIWRIIEIEIFKFKIQRKFSLFIHKLFLFIDRQNIIARHFYKKTKKFIPSNFKKKKKKKKKKKYI
jgi:hypothetical protein